MEIESDNKSKANGANIVSVRVDDDVYDVIKNLASECDTTISMVLRLALDQELEKYLGLVQVRYIDPKQADVINTNIITVGNLLCDIRLHLRRIGCNINQIARMRNAALKQRLSYEDLKMLTQNVPDITKDDIDALLTKMETVTQKVGEWLCSSK